MKSSRRHFLRRCVGMPLAQALLGAGGLGALDISRSAASTSADYKALVTVFLGGGYDGNDLLVRLGAGYQDYSRARPSLALAQDSLKPLSRGLGSEKIATHPCLAPLNDLYESGRLAWIANVGPLVEPATVSQVMNKSVRLPPFMGSHPDQTHVVQGWDPASSYSGWGGRGLASMSSSLNSDMQAISLAGSAMLLSSESFRTVMTSSDASGFWGEAPLNDPLNELNQLAASLGSAASSNRFDAEYAASYSAVFRTAEKLAGIRHVAGATNRTPFPGSPIGRDLGFLARVMPQFKAQGIKRQIFYTEFGRFDTHSLQRGDNDGLGLDIQIDQVCQALRAWDDELRATGMDQNVVTLVFTEFGRTLAPAGSGTDHGWGNHWFVLGTPVIGGQIIGALPSAVLGGADDWDEARRGRWVPQLSSEQVAATLLQWLGVDAASLLTIFPNLNNFTSRTLKFL